MVIIIITFNIIFLFTLPQSIGLGDSGLLAAATTLFRIRRDFLRMCYSDTSSLNYRGGIAGGWDCPVLIGEYNLVG